MIYLIQVYKTNYNDKVLSKSTIVYKLQIRNGVYNHMWFTVNAQI